MAHKTQPQGLKSNGKPKSLQVTDDGYLKIDMQDTTVVAEFTPGSTVRLTDGTDTAAIDSYGSQSVILKDSSGTYVSPVTSVGFTAPTAIADGNKTVTTAGTPVQLLTSSTTCTYVVVTALLANTGLISVGGSTTTPSSTVRGDVLAAGDSTVVLIDNVNKVYINSTVNSEGVSFRYG